MSEHAQRIITGLSTPSWGALLGREGGPHRCEIFQERWETTEMHQ